MTSPDLTSPDLTAPDLTAPDDPAMSGRRVGRMTDTQPMTCPSRHRIPEPGGLS